MFKETPLGCRRKIKQKTPYYFVVMKDLLDLANEKAKEICVNYNSASEYKILTTAKNFVSDLGSAILKIFISENPEPIKKEIEIITELKNQYIVNILDYNVSDYPYYILYQKLITLTDNLSLEKEFHLKLLKDVATGLDHIHSKGYFHGDVSIYNIGLCNANLNYVFFDMETAKKSDSTEKYYEDVEMFLENLIIVLKKEPGYNDIVNLYQTILEKLKKKCVKTREIQKKIGLKLKILTDKIINYNIGDFLKILNSEN